jgi:hypothetical protein
MISFRKIYNESVKQLNYNKKNIIAEDDIPVQSEIVLNYSLLDKPNQKSLDEINLRANVEKYNINIIDLNNIKNTVLIKGEDKDLIEFLLKTGYCIDINDVQNNFGKLNITGYLQSIDDKNKE